MRALTQAVRQFVCDSPWQVSVQLEGGPLPEWLAVPPDGMLRRWSEIPWRPHADVPAPAEACPILDRARRIAACHTTAATRYGALAAANLRLVDAATELGRLGRLLDDQGRKLSGGGLQDGRKLVRVHSSADFFRDQVFGMETVVHCKSNEAHLAAVALSKRRRFPGAVWIRMEEPPFSDCLVTVWTDHTVDQIRESVRCGMEGFPDGGFGAGSCPVTVVPWRGWVSLWNSLLLDVTHVTAGMALIGVPPGRTGPDAPTEEQVDAMCRHAYSMSANDPDRVRAIQGPRRSDFERSLWSVTWADGPEGPCILSLSQPAPSTVTGIDPLDVFAMHFMETQQTSSASLADGSDR